MVKASLRSAGKVDVAALAQIFGGAAMCGRPVAIEGSLHDVIPRVIEQVRLKL